MFTQADSEQLDSVMVFVDYIMPEIQKSIGVSMSALDPNSPGVLLALQIAADYAIGAWIKDQKLKNDTPENHDDLTSWAPTH